LPEKLLRKGKRYVRANAVSLRDLLRKPATHPVALDHDNLRGQRSGQRPRKHARKLIGEALEPVAGVENETAAVGRRHRSILKKTPEISNCGLVRHEVFANRVTGFTIRDDFPLRFSRYRYDFHFRSCHGIR
jgi:hypothetical protein